MLGNAFSFFVTLSFVAGCFQHQQFLKCTVAEPVSTSCSNELSGTLKRVTVSNMSSLMLISLSGALHPSACMSKSGWLTIGVMPFTLFAAKALA